MVEPVLVDGLSPAGSSLFLLTYADTVGNRGNLFDIWCTLVVFRDFAPKVDPDLISHSSDLVNRFRLLCMDGGDDVSSLCVSPGLFDRALSQPALSDVGMLTPVMGTGFL